ncbi:hypothetical protein IDM40_12825 [Nocardiopsis sp. HNM0947]|uniref:Uncharacterized protein n=1 Tax=Nocardiopsis coralli TaxID=2772213 RepID=A0ABR9P6Z1_9ACTN|nr:hypothetical protein [Nocardiopsis coralli]MBE2999584.1 hypothetical protein [Nocardiopsis coralli]
MGKKMLRRAAVVAAAVPALALGAPALAMADSYYGSEASGAGPDGAWQSQTGAYAGEHGTWWYHSHEWANENGAGSSETVTGTG